MQNLDELKKKHAELGEAIKRLEGEKLMNKAAMFVPEPISMVNYYTVGQDGQGRHKTAGCRAATFDSVAPVFRTREHAEAIAFARSIEDQMRAQPGCVVAQDGVDQWAVRFDPETYEPISTRADTLDDKLDFSQWGVFDTEKNLKKAIATVGAENLTRAAKAKVGIY